MIDKIDISVPAVYISEVIPIRYAMADDIANALNSLGGSGGGTVAVGSSIRHSHHQRNCGQPRRRSGVWRNGRHDSTRRQRATSTFGQSRTGLGTQANPNGTPSSATPFQQRLLNIINSAGGGGRRQAGANPDFRPGQNYRRRARQLAARLCHAGGHGANQARHLATGRAARAGAHRIGHH